ncbi:exosortase/archaeosortase family protein [Candidatus Marsarchaeota archaeon]|nr:exosortase/archaeosortase family protein [Candidatus Marsarchaeota archaeon]
MAIKSHKISASVAATAMLFVVFLIAAYNSIAVTGLSISDSNPAGYIIVPMLMTLVFIIFSIKENLVVIYRKRNIAYGAILALIYFAIYAYSKVALSFLFQTYRVDALLFPILLSSFALMLFGTSGLNKLKPAVVFSIFASPLILMPLLGLSGAWTSFNAYSVVSVLKLFGVPVLSHGLEITSASGSSISIASTCADIAAFVAMLLFLIPVAYLYEGNIRNRAGWVASGMAILFVLNIIRMSFIAMVWAYYGLSSALNTVHLFIGQLLFDVTLVVMILLAPKFSMRLSLQRHGQKRKRSKNSELAHGAIFDRSSAIPGLSAIMVALIVFALLMPLANYQYIGPFSFANNSSYVSNSSVISSYNVFALRSGYSMKSLTFAGRSELFGIFANNDINATTNSFLYINSSSRPSLPRISQRNLGTILMHSEESTISGITINAYEVSSNGKLFQVNYLSVPNKVYGIYTVANMEFVTLMNSSSSLQSCNAKYGAVQSAYSYIYNALHFNFRGNGYGIFCAAVNEANAAGVG